MSIHSVLDNVDDPDRTVASGGARASPRRGDTGPGSTLQPWTSSSRTRTRTSTRSGRCSPRGGSTRARRSRCSGSLNRNVREFYRLHADELELRRGRPARPGGDPAPDRRRDRPPASAWASSSRSRAIPRSRSSSSTTTAGEAPDWVQPENLVLSEDGALTTTMVGILAEREIEVTPLEATVFALGIHEDTGSLGYPDVGVARRRGARLVPAPRRAPGHGRAVPAHAALRRRSARSSTRWSPRSRRTTSAGVEVLVAAVAWPDVRRRRLEPRPQDRRPHGRARRSSASWRWTAASSASCARACPSSTRPAIAAALGGGGHPQAASAVLPRLARRGARARPRGAARAARPRAHRGRDHVAPGALRRARRHRSPQAMVAVPAPPPERDPRRRRAATSRASSPARISTRRSATASRTRR